MYPTRRFAAQLLCVLLLPLASLSARASAPDSQELQAAMKRATQALVERVSHEGGYLWYYTRDLSRRWGELEAAPTMVWVQGQGTPAMGQLFLDAYHATGDDYYYQAARRAALALVRGQLPCGGWNYLIDFGGKDSLDRWYATVAKNAWRMEEFHHQADNATFDDGVFSGAALFLLRFHLERRDPEIRPALDRALAHVLESQHRSGAWPQRHPVDPKAPSYSSYLTFNDDVAAGNIDFLLAWYQAFGESRLLEPLKRAMQAFLDLQGSPPQAAWALQYTRDLKPAAARSYEPRALATHTTAACVEQLFRFYRLTGERRFLEAVPPALKWLDACALPTPDPVRGYTHPTFLELGTNAPLYLHRSGSNVANGRYYADRNPSSTVAHYGSFRRIELARLRATLAELEARSPEQVTADSALRMPPGTNPFPRLLVDRLPVTSSYGFEESVRDEPSRLLGSLTPEGLWLAPLRMTSHPFVRQADSAPCAEDYSGTLAGDDTDTSPYRDPAPQEGISTATYIRNMGVLIRAVDAQRRRE